MISTQRESNVLLGKTVETCAETKHQWLGTGDKVEIIVNIFVVKNIYSEIIFLVQRFLQDSDHPK